MPHKCTKCGQLFKDGDKNILSGCPVCGWNKFLYAPEGTQEKETTNIEEVIETDSPKVEETHPTPVSDRLESVRILGPGSYEVNIRALLERDEIVVALKEDGRYIINLPSVFGKKKDE
ncbi:MAG: Zn-ribbon domain-containing protein [Halobacteriota archaeon]|nr:Zn-ribbon domain-containing protein [Halobacteriota archaeon]